MTKINHFCVNGTQTSKPMIKDNFGRVVFFNEVVVGGCNIYIYPNTFIINDKNMILLSKCLEKTAIFESDSKSALINVDNTTIEFRKTCDNYILCFMWNRIVSTSASECYFVDRSSFNYENSNC
jgi:hypothetical protein